MCSLAANLRAWVRSPETPQAPLQIPATISQEDKVQRASISLFLKSFYILASQTPSDRLTLLTMFTPFCVFVFSYCPFITVWTGWPALALSMALFRFFSIQPRSLTFLFTLTLSHSSCVFLIYFFICQQNDSTTHSYYKQN